MIAFIHVLTVLLGIAAVVALSIGAHKNTEDGTINVVFRSWGLFVGICIFVIMLGISLSIGQIGPGERGVVLQFGKVTSRTIDEGPYLLPAFFFTVEKMSVQIQAYEAKVGAASKDLQDVHTEVTLNYRLDSTVVNKVYQTLRRDFTERIIKPAIQEAVKAVTATYEAEKLITDRPQVKVDIEASLRTRLQEHGIVLDTLSITDFNFSESFNAAIEAKVSAAQRALEAENRLRQIKIEALQREAIAEGERKATVQKATGEAFAITTVAEAQANANILLSKSLSDQLIRYYLTQKLSESIKAIVLPTGQEFILGPEVLGNLGK